MVFSVLAVFVGDGGILRFIRRRIIWNGIIDCLIIITNIVDLIIGMWWGPNGSMFCCSVIFLDMGTAEGRKDSAMIGNWTVVRKSIVRTKASNVFRRRVLRSRRRPSSELLWRVLRKGRSTENLEFELLCWDWRRSNWSPHGWIRWRLDFTKRKFGDCKGLVTEWKEAEMKGEGITGVSLNS